MPTNPSVKATIGLHLGDGQMKQIKAFITAVCCMARVLITGFFAQQRAMNQLHKMEVSERALVSNLSRSTRLIQDMQYNAVNE